MIDRIGVKYLSRGLSLHLSPFQKTCPKLCHLSFGGEFLNYKGKLDPQSPCSPTAHIHHENNSDSNNSSNSSKIRNKYKEIFPPSPKLSKVDIKVRTPGYRRSDSNLLTSSINGLAKPNIEKSKFDYSNLKLINPTKSCLNLTYIRKAESWGEIEDAEMEEGEKIAYKEYPRLKHSQMSNLNLHNLELPNKEDSEAKEGQSPKEHNRQKTDEISNKQMPNTPGTQEEYFNNLQELNGVKIAKKGKPIDCPPKYSSDKKYTIILDIDETLVHVPSNTKILFTSANIIAKPRATKAHILFIVRPHLKYFLNSLLRIFEVILYTSGEKSYAEDISKSLGVDPRRFAGICSRNQCHILENGRVIKDLHVIPYREIKEMFIIDDTPSVWELHKEHLFPIKPFYGKKNDTGLLDVFEVLMKALYTEQL